MNLVCTSDGSGLKPLRPLCLDVRNAAKRRGWSTILYELNGAENQKWTLEEDGRMIPHHAGHLCLDIKYGRISAEAKLHTWTHLQIGEPGQFIDNYLTVGGGFGGLGRARGDVVPRTDNDTGARLVLVSRDSPVRSVGNSSPSSHRRGRRRRAQTDLPHPPRETRAAGAAATVERMTAISKANRACARSAPATRTIRSWPPGTQPAGLDDSAVRRLAGAIFFSPKRTDSYERCHFI